MGRRSSRKVHACSGPIGMYKQVSENCLSEAGMPSLLSGLLITAREFLAIAYVPCVQVLERRTGLPITLSLVYMKVSACLASSGSAQ